MGTPLDKTNATKRELGPVLKRAGLPTALRFHDLRPIATTLTLARGVRIPAVGEMLGHADSATKLRVYAHAIPAAQRRIADTFDDPLAN